ncbi:hypothetical protein EON65_43010 [archaeon]|nr:MAG: hypothetical protein EON65_43010 [archaeon]
MRATVTHYRDGKDSTGEIVTMYIINVEPTDAPVYIISKRYSDFAQIFQIFKESLPPDYKFPNKSLFNNNSQFTKERRVKGFQELLAYLLKLHPSHEKIREFLQVSAKASDNIPTQAGVGSMRSGGGLVMGKEPSDSVTSVKDNNQLRKKLASLSQTIAEIQEDFLTFSKQPSAVNNDEKEDIKKLLKISIQISFVTYLLLISLNIIDISQETSSRVILTALALGLLLTFVNLRGKRMEAERRSEDSILQ